LSGAPAGDSRGLSAVELYCTTRFRNAHRTVSRELLYRLHPSVGAKVAPDCRGGAEIQHAALAIQDAWITNLDAAKHRSDLALVVVFDPSKAFAIHAKSANQT
jgi:hypothetical protein